jgi:hypothetical protein
MSLVKGSVRCWSFFVDSAAFGLLILRDRTKRLDPKRTAMCHGNAVELTSAQRLHDHSLNGLQLLRVLRARIGVRFNNHYSKKRVRMSRLA